jgi:uncharacterized repeat protein (TIGR04052 family)
MKISSRLLKLSVILLLLFGLLVALLPVEFSGWWGILAHEGHKKGHAPAAARRLRNPVPHNTQNIENGRALYEQSCQGCHAVDGKGAAFNRRAKVKVPDLASHYVANLTDGEIFYVITHGIPTSGMPGAKAKMSERERWQLVHYVKHFSMTAEEHGAAVAGHQSGGKRDFTIAFKSRVGAAPFECGKSYDGVGTTGSRITPTDFRLYLHRVRLIDREGREVPLELEQDGKWQVDDIALLDFENGTGPCANGTAETREIIRGSAPAGEYSGLKFTVGVPFARNHADPAKAPSPLNLSQLFWVWNSGYKFARIEMQTTGLPNGWMLHLGSTGCQPGGTAQTIPTGCTFANRAEVTLAGFKPGRDSVVTDLKMLLDGANVDVNQPQTARGCMSAPNDADCRPLFANLGLPFAGQPAPGQKFFTVETGVETALGKSPGAGK